MERFAPGVMLRDGRTYTPEGWEWILGFALAGCGWAMEEASKPEFRERIIGSLRERRRENLKMDIEARLDEIERLRGELRGLSEDGR